MLSHKKRATHKKLICTHIDLNAVSGTTGLPHVDTEERLMFDAMKVIEEWYLLI